ncbi:MAG TPA: hypothetical protein VFO87_01880, partial [Nitrospira sp.]|nr:hypothetical protein [Nitrospira sp.]
MLFSLSGCGLFGSRDGAHIGYYLPLTVQLRQAPTVAMAQLTYQDACGQNQVLPFGQQLAEAITRKSGRVFEKIVTGNAPAPVSIDGYEDVSVGMTTLDLFIPRQTTRSHPATLAIGLDFGYIAADGTVLFSKKLQSVGSGDVDVNASSCDIKGLDKIVKEAIANVTDGMAEALGTSVKIRQAAGAGHAEASATGATLPPSPIAQAAPVVPVPVPVPVPAPAVAAAAATEEQPSTLVFRAIIRDENRNQLLHEGESVSVEIEVKNEGPGAAAGVEILVSGTAALVEMIPSVLTVGDIPAGEVKRVSVKGKVGAVAESTQAELVLALRAKSPAVQLPSVKKYLVAVKPANAPEAIAVPVDVDELPKLSSGKLKQPKAVGIAIGIGQFRENAMPRVKYAQQDADTVAKYWSAVGGIPTERIRRLFDSRALKGDLVEMFEEWLPKQADATTVVYVFIAGRGLVDPSTGAVSVIPFDGTSTSLARIYSLRRLQESLSKLPVQRAIVMVDLSLEHMPVQNGAGPAAPVWPQEEQGKERVMWMVGNRAVQDAHHFDLGHHGLFAYQLLKGLGGAADVDGDGTILAGELCVYARGQVAKMAREQFGNEQDPLCVPGPGQGAMVR